MKISVLGSSLLLVFFIGSSCERERPERCGMSLFEYMIFGHFYGKCAGEECIEIYKIENEQLLEDTLDMYPSDLEAYMGSYVSLPQNKYDQVKDLMEDVPEELLQEKNHRIGMPDAGDWGGIYFEIKYEGDSARSGFWLLDQLESNMPDVYNKFVDKINEKIALIHQ